MPIASDRSFPQGCAPQIGGLGLLLLALAIPIVIARADAPAPTTARADGSIVLGAEAARIHGSKLRLQLKPEPTLVNWVDGQESIEWPKAIVKKGKYSVEITYSCPAGAGGEVIVAAAANKFTFTPKVTADWKTFATKKVGTLTVLNDNTALTLHCAYLRNALIDVRSVELNPVAVHSTN